ncbi:MAG: DUF3426 domain-containing protein, partial [Vicinamibacterales bacterium]
CGACGETFDALESLSEMLPKDIPVSIAARPPADAPPRADDHESGKAAAEAAREAADIARDEEEFLEELEALISEEAQPDLAADEDEFLVEDLDEELDEEASRFDAALIGERPVEASEPGAPENDSRPPEPPPEGPLEPPLAPAPGGDVDHWPYDDLDEDIPDPDSVFRVDEFEDEPDAGAPEHFVGADDEPSEAKDVAAAPAAGVVTREPGREHDDQDRGPENDRDEGDAWDEHEGDDDQPRAGARSEPQISSAEEDEPVPEFARAPGRGRTWLRVLLALLAVLVLSGTWAHTQHGKLLRHPLGEAVLGPVYALLGIEAVPDWSPAEFRAVQWEAIADPNQADHLTVAVDFTNGAAYAQPYPVIRIMLEDRFGRRIGTHDIPPEQYLGERPGAGRLPAGSRFRTTLVVPDPGGRADGFRVDFCLELPARGLVCGPEPFR